MINISDERIKRDEEIRMNEEMQMDNEEIEIDGEIEEEEPIDIEDTEVEIVKIKLWNLVNDENNMPKLNVINEVTLFSNLYVDSSIKIPVLCKLTKMHKAHVENVYMAVYDLLNKLIGFFYIGCGSIAECHIPDRVVATCLLVSGGFSYEIFHNHTIDVQEPSASDKGSCYHQQALAGFLESKFLNGYVVTKGGWTEILSNEQYRFTKEEIEYMNSNTL